jgi:hypothetical protein
MYIVLHSDGDFTEISRNNPSIRKHVYYKPGVEFPSQISDLLPPSEDRWWERLGESALTDLSFSHNPCAASKYYLTKEPAAEEPAAEEPPAAEPPAEEPPAEELPTISAPSPLKIRIPFRPRPEQPPTNGDAEEDELEEDELEEEEPVPVSNQLFIYSPF